MKNKHSMPSREEMIEFLKKIDFYSCIDFRPHSTEDIFKWYKTEQIIKNVRDNL